ncbi:hypothetical protein [Micromonospora sp. 4G55]|uniref:hypothetical protein n=1 Tax=Micromonospora sp. 4G55 TaxID=2806102 RepID=UPI001A3C6C43|nr:hypothetical protein [Micromonospora sp. 4G55]MBM0257385.1 hypothetical protein [Micromonospora sp. 4G55]MBM0259359.1 hypothetical protein [Micromonospora sp. 4G55]
MASVFGVAPAEADAVDEVRTVYTWVNCRWVGLTDVAEGPAGVDLNQLSGLGMPIALHLGPPVTYEAPEDGEENPDVRRIFPRSLEAAAFSHPWPSAQDELRQRVLQVVGSSAPSPSPSHS